MIKGKYRSTRMLIIVGSVIAVLLLSIISSCSLVEQAGSYIRYSIFRQADNGVLVRMALFALVLDVVDQVDKYATDARWYTGGRKG